MNAPRTIEALLLPGSEEGTDFLADIRTMLVVVAGAYGYPLDLDHESATRRCWRLPAGTALAGPLALELGIHRGQLVRAPGGRIHTYKVAIRPAPGVDGAEALPVIRTYNYPLQRVSFHRSGTRADLREVLQGVVRDPGGGPEDCPPGAACAARPGSAGLGRGAVRTVQPLTLSRRLLSTSIS